MIYDNNVDVFNKLDTNFNKNYQYLLINYINLLENINNYLKTKDKNLLNIAKNNYKDFISYVNLTNNYVNNYIEIQNYKNIKIVVIKDKKYSIALKPLQNKIIDKLIKLKNNNKIDNITFNNSIKDYNNFILYFSIWKKTNNIEYKKYSINSLSEVLKIYNKK